MWMDVTLRVRVPEGIDEKLVGEMAEIFARAQALRMLASSKGKVRPERASWGSFVSIYRSTGTFLDSSVLF